MEQLASAPVEKDTGVRWNLTARVSFRFVFAYLSLLSVYLVSEILTVLIYMLGNRLPSGLLLGLFWNYLVPWTGKYILHLGKNLVPTNNGSGDTSFDWVLVFCQLIIACVVTIVWSLLDRNRSNYRKLHQWLRLIVRVLLGTEMILYGARPFRFNPARLHFRDWWNRSARCRRRVCCGPLWRPPKSTPF